MQPEDPRHRRRFRAPRAPQAEHQRADRRERVSTDDTKIDDAARPAARAEYLERWRPGEQRGAESSAARIVGDQAGMSMRLAVPPNITIIALPPKSRELNPVENVWHQCHPITANMLWTA
jgi:transposase